MIVKSSEIKEIVLNPAYCTDEEYIEMKKRDVPVRWMEEDEGSDNDIFTFIVDE